MLIALKGVKTMNNGPIKEIVQFPSFDASRKTRTGHLAEVIIANFLNNEIESLIKCKWELRAKCGDLNDELHSH